MNGKNHLCDFLKNSPTFLRIPDEITLMQMLSSLPVDWIRQNKSEFTDALNKLADSHTVGSGFVEQKEEDDALFDQFCQWLSDIQGETGIRMERYIDDLSSNYVKQFRRESAKLKSKPYQL